jgi:hypothetical protein
VKPNSLSGSVPAEVSGAAPLGAGRQLLDPDRRVTSYKPDSTAITASRTAEEPEAQKLPTP